MKLSSLILGIKSPQESIAYYTSQLGMELADSFHQDNISRYILRFPNSEHSASLELHHNKDHNNSDEIYNQASQDSYWKYSLFVDNIQQVHQSLDAQYLSGEPYQFGDIGYLLHTKDSDNYQIEYIQKYFKQNTKATSKEEQFPLKEAPVFGLITLRTKDPLRSIRYYEYFFGLKFMVRMYVDRGNGFTLYFLGPNHLEVPNIVNPDAIENREWMYQQKETFIELQYYWGTEQQPDYTFDNRSNKVFGFKGVVFDTLDLNNIASNLIKAGLPVQRAFEEAYQEPIISLQSPDSHPVIIRQRLVQNTK